MNEFQQYFLDVLTNKYADFEGRATRSEYWFYILFQILSYLILIPIIFLLGPRGLLIGVLLYFILAIAYFLPSLAVAVRRLHDAGKSGLWFLLALIPGGGLVLIIFFCLDSQPFTNKWGPNPHTLYSDDSDIIDSDLNFLDTDIDHYQKRRNLPDDDIPIDELV